MTFYRIGKILCVLTALTILILSLTPIPPQSELIQLSDKMSHLIAYCFLSCLIILTFKSKNTSIPLLAIITLCVCTLYGSVIEFLQSFTNRTPELLDIVADLTGSIIGILIAIVILFIKKKLRS